MGIHVLLVWSDSNFNDKLYHKDMGLDDQQAEWRLDESLLSVVRLLPTFAVACSSKRFFGTEFSIIYAAQS
jgi:hypothetical protein